MKNIVICCDGTSNDISGAPTNVLRFYRSLARDEGQLAYYDSGVGTIADPSMLTDPGRAFGKKLDMAVGYSVQRQARQAYRFLSEHWQPDDAVYLAGFSRGAYAVRALAGMVHRLGILRRDSLHLDNLGWSIYSAADFKACANFKYSFSTRQDVPIHMMCAWDTVSSFGRITNFKTLPDTRRNPSIAHIRHAVAIHENRACFKANLFSPENQDCVELWFNGCHSDIGGGYDEQESGLAKIALEWMIDEARELGCRFLEDQVEFFLGRSDSEYFQRTPDPNDKIHVPVQGFWHALEFVPRRQWNHHVQPERMTWFAPNLYRDRELPTGARLHSSVNQRTAPARRGQ